MNRSHVYTLYHPRWLRRPMSTYWWLGKWCYFRFILREFSCMFVAWFVVYLLMAIAAVGQGPDRYTRFMEWSASGLVLVTNVVAFLFIVFHAVTFFEAAPQALVLHVGARRVPGGLVLAGHYAGWLAASAIVAWLLVG
jgi:fumarate reductase subunit C